MLRIPALSRVQQRELRQWQSSDDPRLARRAQIVLWSARGWSVPALSHVLGCCRRTVRRWLHAFLDADLVGLLGRSAEPRESQRGPTGDSAMAPNPPATAGRLVPVVPISAPELRRILVFHWCSHPVDPEFFWHWSTWRRYKRALAMRSHHQKRGATPPDFAHVRL